MNKQLSIPLKTSHPNHTSLLLNHLHCDWEIYVFYLIVGHDFISSIKPPYLNLNPLGEGEKMAFISFTHTWTEAFC